MHCGGVVVVARSDSVVVAAVAAAAAAALGQGKDAGKGTTVIGQRRHLSANELSNDSLVVSLCGDSSRNARYLDSQLTTESYRQCPNSFFSCCREAKEMGVIIFL